MEIEFLELLLNESAIYQVEKEISDISSELLREPKIQFHVQLLRLIVERLEEKNKLHRKNIYQNNFEIKSLEDENK